MTRSARAMADAALKADAAAEQLNAWLQQPRGPVPDVGSDAGRAASGPVGRPLTGAVAAVHLDEAAAAAETVETIGAKALDDPTPDRAGPDRAGPAVACEGRAVAGIPMRLPHTDWLHHRLVVTGPADALAGFQADASGAGTIPWQLDGDRMAEDLFHRLAAPPAPQRRRLSLAGARELARQLRDAVELRHAAACARVGHSRACAFDLHALVPVPPDILRLGPDEPDAPAWLWAHWGTTAPLRHVAVELAPLPRTPLPAGTATAIISFWSADWTPWRALAAVRARWPALQFDVRLTYGLL